MNRPTATQLRDDYLARLDAAMHRIPHGVASDIRAGIAEELEGADAASTAARIAQLGDPEVIAREAEAAGSTLPKADPTVVAATTPLRVSRGFAIAAALTLSFGAVVLPAAGWIIGAVMVCVSRMWRTGEKLVAIAAPAAALAAVVVFAFLPWWSSSGAVSADSGPPEGAADTLLPTLMGVVGSSAVIAALLLVPASGLWLLWRMRGR